MEKTINGTIYLQYQSYQRAVHQTIWTLQISGGHHF